mgnify:CR=1 FL=1
MTDAGIRFRTGKALVPFRISGNVEWGVPVPVIEGAEGLTAWCWPEAYGLLFPLRWHVMIIVVLRAVNGARSGAIRNLACISLSAKTIYISME